MKKNNKICGSPGKFVGSPTKRREMDVMKLMMSDYEVKIINESTQNFYVKFHGPKKTPYEGGCWRVKVSLPDQYPYKSPSIGFTNTIYHPNVDETSGTVCLDVINQTWSPLFDLINIFEVFLPQLLAYPNPTDPMNGEAAALMLKYPEKYKKKIQEYVKKFAQEKEVFKNEEEKKDESDDSLSIASVGSADLNDFDFES